jgi:predicted AlkP superfamily phosphohydrolase/phosphomutase/tetratricopeptide (TPR) repeat protein
MVEKKRKVLLVGWDSADWNMIDKLMAAGLMPAMKKLVDNGVRGRIATLDPPLSPMLWTSMATGVRPYKHGILGFVESDGSGGVRPISSYGRKVNAFWNIFTKEGLKSNVVGWWPSNPVESINGVMVSNLFQQEKSGTDVIAIEDWVVPPGTVYPESYVERLSELRVHPQEITGNLIMPFVPKAVELNQKEDKRLPIIGRFLAHSSTLHAVATELMETEEWDITAVYHDALDHFSHGFMKFHAPKMEGLDQEQFDFYKDVVNGAYVYHDMMLDRLLNMVDDDTTVIVVSDHGFHSDHLRPLYIPKVPSGPAVEHAPFGVFAAMGPGIKKGEQIFGARVLDLTPTLLSLFDLPIGRDMDGIPLMDIYDHPKEIEYIDSWENDKRFGGELLLTETADESTNAAALQQLIDLGYIDDMAAAQGSDEAMKNNLKEIIRENNYYLAKSYSNGGKYDECLEILLEIENKDKPDFRFLIDIIDSACKTKRFKLAEEYIAYVRANELMAERYLDVLEAQVSIGMNEPVKALILLERALEEFPDSLQVLIDLGKLLLSLSQFEKAESVFRECLKLDAKNVYAFHGIGVSYLRREMYDNALENFLIAVDGLFHYPIAHLHIGETLALMKDYENAIHAFEIVEAIAPVYKKTYRWLQDLHEIQGNEEKAEHYSKMVSKFHGGEVKIITGLEGEKLINAINELRDSGVSVNANTEDIYDNFRDVGDRDWIEGIKEDVIYIPIGLLPSLIMRYSYRILYVKDEYENAMEFINHKTKIRTKTLDSKLLDDLKKQENRAVIWVNQQPSLDILHLADPADLSSELFISFIGSDMKI